jgi:RNA polymerase sigma-70 factor, ECF subfamily
LDTPGRYARPARMLGSMRPNLFGSRSTQRQSRGTMPDSHRSAPALRAVHGGNAALRPLAERDDDELMLLCRGGIAAAFEELVRRHQRRALRVASKLLGGSATAADAVQETFSEIYLGRARYQPRGRFGAYLYQVLLNRCRMAGRRLRQDRRAQETAETEHCLEGSAQAPAETAILARERRLEVERALAKLSDKLRVVIVLRFNAEMSYQEIADVLELPLGTVKRRLFDGLSRLRPFMERP